MYSYVLSFKLIGKKGENLDGAKRTRTADPLHAMQVLYQLSYGPKLRNVAHINQSKDFFRNVLNPHSTLQCLIIEICNLKCAYRVTSFSMLSRYVPNQFLTFLKSQVGHCFSVEGRKSKGRIFYNGNEIKIIKAYPFLFDYQYYIVSIIMVVHYY